MPFTPVDTQRWIPWAEPVTVTSVRPASADVTEGADDAGVHRLGVGEGAPSRGAYTRHDIRVTLGTDALSFVPKPRDMVTWQGDTYTVLSVDRSDWTRHYVLTARNLVLSEDLRQTGTLSRPVNARDDAGRPARGSYATVTADVPCRLQPAAAAAGDTNEKRTIPVTFTCFVGLQLDARAGDRFTVAGEHYGVLGVTNPERIDELMSLNLGTYLP